MAGQRPIYQVEKRYVRKDGAVIWAEVTAAMVWDAAGKPLRSVGVIQDITDRKRAEESLHPIEGRFRALFEHAPDAVLLATREGRVTAANSAACAMFGMTEAEICLAGRAGLVDPDDSRQPAALAERDLVGRISAVELSFRRKSGQTFPVEITSVILPGDGTRAFDTIRDITERKRAEAVLLPRLRDRRHRATPHPNPLNLGNIQHPTSNAQHPIPRGEGAASATLGVVYAADSSVKASEQEFRTLAETVPQMVWATGPDGWAIYFNQQWGDYTGLTLEESCGHGWNTPFHPDDKQRALEAWQGATQHDKPYSLECRLRRADGVYRWWLIRGKPMRSASGEILKWFGTCTDIEEIKQAEQAQRTSAGRLRMFYESGLVGILSWHNDGRITEVNDRYLEISNSHYGGDGNAG